MDAYLELRKSVVWVNAMADLSSRGLKLNQRPVRYISHFGRITYFVLCKSEVASRLKPVLRCR